jgi:hypothetical protein
VAALWRPGIDRFFFGQQLQQPIVLDFIALRIAFRLGYQPAVVRKVLPMQVLFHLTSGVHGRFGIMGLSSEAVERLTWRDKAKRDPGSCAAWG